MVLRVSFSLPVQPTAIMATAAKLTAYDVELPKASHQISHVATKAKVAREIT